MVEMVEGEKCATMLLDRSFGFTRAYSRCVLGTPAALLSQPAPWHVPLEPYQQPSGHPQTEYRRAGAAARATNDPRRDCPREATLSS